MIKFNSICNDKPYLIFKDLYKESLKFGQKNVEAISIASYSPELQEVNSRYVNLKFINKKDFIFFSNYNSPKSNEFKNHNQITCLIYWDSINVQIRIKANIKKTSKKFNDEYFCTRDYKKNALAISSDQSRTIISYEAAKENFNKAIKNSNLTKCPDYWGGFSFTPYYFEFWRGNESRINKRVVYELKKEIWVEYFLQP